MSSPALLLGPLPRSASFPISWKTDPAPGLSEKVANPPFSQYSYVTFLSYRGEREWCGDEGNSGAINTSLSDLSSSDLCLSV